MCIKMTKYKIVEQLSYTYVVTFGQSYKGQFTDTNVILSHCNKLSSKDFTWNPDCLLKQERHNYFCCHLAIMIHGKYKETVTSVVKYVRMRKKYCKKCLV